MTELSLFARRLRQARERKQLGITQLADLAGVPYETIYRLETGKHKSPRLDIALKLARALGVGLDYLSGTFEEDTDSVYEPALVDGF